MEPGSSGRQEKGYSFWDFRNQPDQKKKILIFYLFVCATVQQANQAGFFFIFLVSLTTWQSKTPFSLSTSSLHHVISQFRNQNTMAPCDFPIQNQKQVLKFWSPNNFSSSLEDENKIFRKGRKSRNKEKVYCKIFSVRRRCLCPTDLSFPLIVAHSPSIYYETLLKVRIGDFCTIYEEVYENSKNVAFSSKRKPSHLPVSTPYVSNSI